MSIITAAGGVEKVDELAIGDVWMQLLGLLSVGTLGTMVTSSCFALAATMLQPEPDPNPLAAPFMKTLDMVKKVLPGNADQYALPPAAAAHDAKYVRRMNALHSGVELVKAGVCYAGSA